MLALLPAEAQTVAKDTVEVHLAGCPKDMSKEDAAAIIAVVGCLDNIVEVTDWREIQALWVAKDSPDAPMLLQARAYGRFYSKRDELAKWRASQSDAGAVV